MIPNVFAGKWPADIEAAKYYPPSTTDRPKLGIGALSDCISCHVVEERNGPFYLELEYPAGGNAWDTLVPGNLIRCVPYDDGLEQLFIIDSAKPSLSGRISVMAVHISYMTKWEAVRPFTTGYLSVACENLSINNLSGGTGQFPVRISHSGFTDQERSKTVRFPYPRTRRACLMGERGSLLDIFGGEYDYEDSGTLIVLKKSRGSELTQGIRYGKNMISMDLEKALAETYNGVYGYYYDEQTGTYVGGNAVKKCSSSYQTTGDRIKLVDFTSDYESGTVPTAAQLDAKALSYAQANGVGEPQVSIKCGFVPLHQTLDYADFSGIEHVKLCDTLPVIYERYGIEITAKVVRTDYDVLTERYRSIEVGTKRTTLPEFLKGVSSKTGVSVWT